MSHTSDRKREATTVASRAWAHRNAEPWTDTDCKLMLSWDGTDEHLVTLSKELKRTTEACRRWFYGKRPAPTRSTGTTTTSTTYRGWMEGDGDGWD